MQRAQRKHHNGRATACVDSKEGTEHNAQKRLCFKKYNENQNGGRPQQVEHTGARTVHCTRSIMGVTGFGGASNTAVPQNAAMATHMI